MKIYKQRNNNTKVSYPECHSCLRFDMISNTCTSAINRIKSKRNRLSYEEIILSYKDPDYGYYCENHIYPQSYWETDYKLIQSYVVEPSDDDRPSSAVMIFSDYVEKIAL